MSLNNLSKTILLIFVCSFTFSFELCPPKVGNFFAGCEEDGCEILRYPKAVKSVRIYDRPDLSSKVVDRLERCEKFHGFKKMLLTKKIGFGTLKVDKFMDQRLNGSKGKSFKAIQATGNGFYKVCVDNKIYEVDVAEISTEQKVRNELWIEIKTPRGITGYARGNRPFYMGQLNFDSTLLCPKERHTEIGVKVSEVELTNLEKRNQAIFKKVSPSRWDGEYFHIEQKQCYKVFRKGASLFQQKEACTNNMKKLIKN